MLIEPSDIVSVYYFPTERSHFGIRDGGADNGDLREDFDYAPEYDRSRDDSMDRDSTSISSYEKPPLKERLMADCLKCIDILCVWDCCWCWVRVQELVALIVFDPFMELFITLCIVVNTLFMAMDHHNMDPDIDRILYNGNLVTNIICLIISFIVKILSIYSFSLPSSELRRP